MIQGQFHPGDIVQLNSGGPSMTVEEINRFGGTTLRARCIWFDGSKKHDDIFELHALTKDL